MAGPADPPDGGDGSMETILASIRRIIREDESAAAQPPEPPVAPVEEEEDELLVLEPSMMLQQHPPEEARMTAGSHQASAAQTAAALAAALFDEPDPPLPVRPQPAAAAPTEPGPVAAAPVSELLSPRPTHSLVDEPDDTLLAPQTRAAAAQAFAVLQQAIRPEPPAATEMRVTRSGGVTLEDIARDEVRGQLKAWLDANLPELVERVVRQEIERLVRPG